MGKCEVCRKITDIGKGGKRTLIYSITSDEPTEEIPSVEFGVGIRVLESGEETEVHRITIRRSEAEKLLDLLATNFVTPVSLGEIVEDWLCI